MKALSSTSDGMKPGTHIKESLAKLKLSQKKFAEAMGASATHLNEILNGRRKVTLAFAQKTETVLGIPAETLLAMQNSYDLLKQACANLAEANAQAELRELDTVINVSALLKGIKPSEPTALCKLAILREKYDVESSDKIVQSFKQLETACFRRSAKTGLDRRMIATWVVKAEAEALEHRPRGKFSQSSEHEVCTHLAGHIHSNDENVNIQDFLSDYGIGFCEVSKLDHASIDGYSFMRDGTPYIVITGRFKRIDNLAFTIFHELGHIYLSHTNNDSSNINMDLRSFDIDDQMTNSKEKAADLFATNCLIPESVWNDAPTIKVLNPFDIQRRYTSWARTKGLNPWIVLGRLSYETGIYKFKSDSSRMIRIRKGGAPMQ